MAKIIGREKEMQTLDECMKSGRSEFVAVYGRRRIGKTFLIRSMNRGKTPFTHSLLQGSGDRHGGLGWKPIL